MALGTVGPLGIFLVYEKVMAVGEEKFLVGSWKRDSQESFILLLLPLLVSLLSYSVGYCSWQGDWLRSGLWPAFLFMLVQGVPMFGICDMGF